MRELVLNRSFEALPDELFERATEDDEFESKLLILTKKSDVEVSEWTKQDNHATRVIGYVIPASFSPILAQLSKGTDVSVSKFQDAHFNAEKTEFTLDYKLLYAQTQAISNIRVLLQLSEPATTQCTVSIKNSCKNQLLRDKLERTMEEEIVKDMNLWMEMLLERHMAHKAMQMHRPLVEDLESPLSSSALSSGSVVAPGRALVSKAMGRSAHDLQGLGEMEEIRVLSGGLSSLSSELDLLRRTVESHYVRLCSLESHLISQSQSHRTHSNPEANAHGQINERHLNETSTVTTGASTSSLGLSPAQANVHVAFNSLEELEARQRSLRSQLTAQMQNIEKAILKQQQASQQIKTLESRWDTMIDTMTKHLQEIDTLRFGLFGSWRYSLSLFSFIIIWPLIVRYFWKSFGKRWIFNFIKRYWKTSQKNHILPSPSSAASTATAATAAVVAVSSSIASSSSNSLTSILSSAFHAVKRQAKS
jgi:hypothetical protein